MDSAPILAVTHEVSFRLKGEAGGYYVEHRTIGLPDDDLLDDLSTAARRTYERIHGIPPERLHVFATPLADDERDGERQRAQEDLRAIRASGQDEADDLSDLESLCEDLFRSDD